MENAPEPIFETPQDIKVKENLLEYKEYKIKKDNSFIDILIGKEKENVVIRSLFYENKYNVNDLSLLTKILYNSIDESYEFIKNSLEENKVIIKNMSKTDMKIIILIYDLIKRKEKEIELNLKAQLKNEGYIISYLINKYFQIEQELNILKNENKKINEDNIKLKEENIKLINEIKIIRNDIYNLKSNINNINNINKMNNINNMNNNMNNMNNINNMNNNNINNIDIMNNINNMSNMNNMNNINNMEYGNMNPNYQQINYMLNDISDINPTNQKYGINSINLFFRTNYDSSIITINCFSKDKLSDVFEKYRDISKIYIKDYKFIFNSKNLNGNLTVSEAGLIDNSTIYVVKIKI